MERDIFKRKLQARGYDFPKTEEGECLFKMFDLSSKDFSIESTAINDRKSIIITITRFLPNGMTEHGNMKWDIQKVSETECRSLEDAISFIDGIEQTLKGKPVMPFDKILSDNGLRFIKKKEWVCKAVRA